MVASYLQLEQNNLVSILIPFLVARCTTRRTGT